MSGTPSVLHTRTALYIVLPVSSLQVAFLSPHMCVLGTYSAHVQCSPNARSLPALSSCSHLYPWSILHHTTHGVVFLRIQILAGCAGEYSPLKQILYLCNYNSLLTCK